MESYQMRCLLAFACFSLVVPGASFGQGPTDSQRMASYANVWYANKAPDGTVTERGNLSVERAEGSSTLHASWWCRGSGTAEVDLPLNHVGSLQQLSDDVFLLSGDREDQGVCSGVLCLLTLSQSTTLAIVVSQVTEVSGSDLHRMVWNPVDNLIYAMDWTSKSVGIAPWAGLGQPLPISFTPVLTGVAAPYHGASDWEAIKKDPGVPGFRVKSERVFPWAWVHFDQVSNAFVTRYDPAVRSGAKTWNVVRPIPTGATARQSDGSTVAGTAQFEIAGPQGDARVVDSQGSTITTYTLLHDWQYQTVTVPAVFNDVPGNLFVLVGDGPTDLEIRPTVRFGLAVNTSKLGLTFADPQAEDCVVGNVNYNVTGEIEFESSPAAASNVTCYLAIGVRNADGTDPVDSVGNSAVLNPVATQGFLRDVMAKRESVPIAYQMPVPADPELEGGVLLYQWIALDQEGQVGWSEVFGTAIQAAPAAAATTATTTWLTADFTEREAIRQRLIRSLRGMQRDPGLSAPEVEFGVLRQRMLQRLRGR